MYVLFAHELELIDDFDLERCKLLFVVLITREFFLPYVGIVYVSN